MTKFLAFIKKISIDLGKFHPDWPSLFFVHFPRCRRSLGRSSISIFSWTNSRLVWRNVRLKDACVETRSKLTTFHPGGRVRTRCYAPRNVKASSHEWKDASRRVLPRRAKQARFPFSILAFGIINKLMTVAALISHRDILMKLKETYAVSRIIREDNKTKWTLAFWNVKIIITIW